jgi:hypothetical protein
LSLGLTQNHCLIGILDGASLRGHRFGILLQGMVFAGESCTTTLWDVPLLEGMNQFVAQEIAAFAGLGAEFAISEVDLLSKGVGAGLQGSGRLTGAGVGVNPHGAEIAAELRLEERPRGGVERLAPRCIGVSRRRRVSVTGGNCNPVEVPGRNL